LCDEPTAQKELKTLGRYLYNLLRDQAKNSLNALFDDKGADIPELLRDMLSLQDQLSIYIEALEEEMSIRRASEAVGMRNETEQRSP